MNFKFSATDKFLNGKVSVRSIPSATVLSGLFFCGCCGILFCRELVAVQLLLFLALVPLFCCLLIPCQTKFFSMITVFLLGFAWGTFFANQALNNQLPVEFEKKPIKMTIQIIDFPKGNQSYLSFMAKVLYIEHTGKPMLKINSSVRLACYRCEQIFELGDWFEIEAVFKRPRGSQSWNAFDFERFAVSQRIVATGYIKNANKIKQGNNKIAALTLIGFKQTLSQLRKRIQNHLRIIQPENASFAILSALSIGDRSAFTPEMWRVLRATGLSHIVAISGLHIGLVFLLFRFLIRKIINLLYPLYLIFPAVYIESLLALLFAATYAAMAGFSLPTQRALIMLTLYCLSLFSPRKISLLSLAFLTVGVIVTMNPLVILGASFWLSVSAVMLIALAQLTRKRSVLYFQWFLSFAMAPLLLSFFSEVSLISPIVNLLVVPLVSFIVLPFLFAALSLLEVLPQFGNALLLYISQSIQFAWELLTRLEMKLTVSSILLTINQWTYFVSLSAVLLIIFWSVLPNKRAIVLVVIIAILLKPNHKKLAYGEFILTTFDVGQGLAIAIQTPNGISIFDTGNRYGDNDSAQQVIIPYLQRLRARHLNTIIISHLDSDHVGGLGSLIKHYSYDRLMTSEKIQFNSNLFNNFPSNEPKQVRCHKEMTWQESGVNFTILAPSKKRQEKSLSRNNKSCVLLLESQWGSVLLPGDIERNTEHYLVEKSADKLKADVLVLAHHGSLTSTSPVFLHLVKPSIAIASSGYLSRHGHPHEKVVSRVEKMGAKLYNTATSGSIQIRFSETGFRTIEYRAQQRRFWYAND